MSEKHVNMGQAERAITLAGGAALSFYGLRKHSWLGAALAAAGAAMIARSASGHCPVYERLGIDTAHHGRPRLLH